MATQHSPIARIGADATYRGLPVPRPPARAVPKAPDGPVEEGFRRLAAAVVMRAVDDAYSPDRKRSRQAWLQFLHGDLDVWLDATALAEETKQSMRHKMRLAATQALGEEKP